MTRRTGLARLGRLGGRREEGQTIVIVALCLVVFIGAAGLVIDVANLYVTQRHLQTAADAAALAAAQDLPNSTTSACTYSASTAGSSTCTVNGTNVALAGNGDNYGTTFGNVQTTAQVECVSVASAGTSCQTGTACPSYYPPAGKANTNLGCNAIKVTEQTNVTPFFMGVLGFGSQTITASATAGLAGGTPEPLDVEMIDDTTASMGDSDTCGGTPEDVPSTVSLTQEDCAKAGIRALLTTLYPCSQTLASCGPYLNDQTQASGGAVDEVGLVAFPGLTGLSAGSDGSLSNELDCASNVTSSNVSYGSGANYQVVPFFERLPLLGRLDRRPARNAQHELEPRAGRLLARRRLPQRRLPDPGRLDLLDQRRRRRRHDDRRDLVGGDDRRRREHRGRHRERDERRHHAGELDRHRQHGGDRAGRSRRARPPTWRRSAAARTAAAAATPTPGR